MTLKFTDTNFGTGKRVYTLEEANSILNEWVLNPKLKLHMQQVAENMKNWATQVEKLSDEEAHKWYVAGLLHDADWDQWPDEHCHKIVNHMMNDNIDATIIRAVASHGPVHFGIEPESTMDKMIYALDELSGFVHAVSLVRGGYDGMKVKSVKKKFKDKGFAAGVNRDEVNDAISRIDHTWEEVVEFVIGSQAETS